MDYQAKQARDLTGLVDEELEATALATFPCDICYQAFPSLQQLHSHKYCKHEIVNPIRLRVYGTTCLSCKTEFHTLRRNFRHIVSKHRFPTCGQYYLNEVSPMSFETYKIEVAKQYHNVPGYDKLIPPPAIKLAYDAWWCHVQSWSLPCPVHEWPACIAKSYPTLFRCSNIGRGFS